MSAYGQDNLISSAFVTGADDYADRRVTLQGHPVNLTDIEYRFMAELSAKRWPAAHLPTPAEKGTRRR